jgi:hypothetical protein
VNANRRAEGRLTRPAGTHRRGTIVVVGAVPALLGDAGCELGDRAHWY